MSFAKCYEPFPGDSNYRKEQRTFEAASDEEATKKAEELAGQELNMDNASIHYQLEEYRGLGSFTQTKKPETATKFPRLSSTGLRGAAQEGRRQLRGR
ncbi:MAG: hypothetical protein KGH79_02595 [Patescibacteria group bacterium]|nr:hypothetical protein [Patescibacteria group bacterium]